MMTRPQFESARRAVPRRAAPLVLFIFFGFCVGFIVFASQIIDLEKAPFYIALPAAIIPVMLFCILPIWFITRAFYRKAGLICPSCGSVLPSDNSILRTGRCKKCQTVIFHV